MFREEIPSGQQNVPSVQQQIPAVTVPANAENDAGNDQIAIAHNHEPAMCRNSQASKLLMLICRLQAQQEANSGQWLGDCLGLLCEKRC